MGLPLTQLHPKVAAATVAGGFVTVGEWVLSQTTHVVIPSSVDAALVLLATFGLGYLIPSDNSGASTTPVIQPIDVPPITVVT